MPEQPTPTPVAPPPEETQRADPLASAVAEAGGPLRVAPVAAREGDGELLPRDDEADRDERLGERRAEEYGVASLLRHALVVRDRVDARAAFGERRRQRARLRLGRPTRRQQ